MQPCCPPSIAALTEALRGLGLTDSAAVEMMETYVRRGTLAASDVIILNAHHGPARGQWIAGRWGPGAGPVAELAHELGIGGELP